MSLSESSSSGACSASSITSLKRFTLCSPAMISCQISCQSFLGSIFFCLFPRFFLGHWVSVWESLHSSHECYHHCCRFLWECTQTPVKLCFIMVIYVLLWTLSTEWEANDDERKFGYYRWSLIKNHTTKHKST